MKLQLNFYPKTNIVQILEESAAERLSLNRFQRMKKTVVVFLAENLKRVNTLMLL